MVYEYEHVAMKGGEMPDGLSLPDQLNFLGLRMLYETHRAGGITREAAKIEKGKLSYQRDKLERELRIKEGLVRKSAELFRDVERAASAYRKNRTLENADRLFAAVTPGMRQNRTETGQI